MALQKTTIFILAAVRILNPTKSYILLSNPFKDIWTFKLGYLPTFAKIDRYFSQCWESAAFAERTAFAENPNRLKLWPFSTYLISATFEWKSSRKLLAQKT
jgi:hypothetical protein